jgi:nitrosocyanin
MKLVRNVAVVFATLTLAVFTIPSANAAEESATPSATSTSSATTSASSSPAAAETPGATAAGEKDFTVVAEKIGNTKFWLPSTIVVHEGDHVKLKLKDEVPGDPDQHGFQLQAFNITELVVRGKEKTVEFTADKTGVFPYICQIHPPHIGGQLVVLPK